MDRRIGLIHGLMTRSLYDCGASSERSSVCLLLMVTVKSTHLQSALPLLQLHVQELTVPHCSAQLVLQVARRLAVKHRVHQVHLLLETQQTLLHLDTVRQQMLKWQ